MSDATAEQVREELSNWVDENWAPDLTVRGLARSLFRASLISSRPRPSPRAVRTTVSGGARERRNDPGIGRPW